MDEMTCLLESSRPVCSVGILGYPFFTCGLLDCIGYINFEELISTWSHLAEIEEEEDWIQSLWGLFLHLCVHKGVVKRYYAGPDRS